MFLRWMVRSPEKGVDLGIWKSISPSELYIPLDVHTGRNARKLGLLNRKYDDWKALDELMKKLKEFLKLSYLNFLKIITTKLLILLQK